MSARTVDRARVILRPDTPLDIRGKVEKSELSTSTGAQMARAARSLRKLSNPFGRRRRQRMSSSEGGPFAGGGSPIFRQALPHFAKQRRCPRWLLDFT